jgi:polyisoprenoid-binding protein YceI
MLGILMLLGLGAPGGTPLRLDPQATQTITFGVVHKLHHIQGVSHQIAGKALELPDGTVQVGVKADVASFDSGNGNRDAHIKEVVEVVRFPDVSVKALVAHAVPQTLPAKVAGQAQVEVTLHGVAQKVTAPVEMNFADATHVRVTGHFEVSWDAFKIERPSLLFVPIDDQGEVKFDLSWTLGGP